MTCYLPWGRIPGCIIQEEIQQVSTQIIDQEFLTLQRLMVISENACALTRDQEALLFQRAKNNYVIEAILGIALKQGM